LHIPLKSEPEKLAKILHDLYVLLPVIQAQGNDEWVKKHLQIIDYYQQKHDEAVTHWHFFDKAA